jgi:hypothetical protein
VKVTRVKEYFFLCPQHDASILSKFFLQHSFPGASDVIPFYSGVYILENSFGGGDYEKGKEKLGKCREKKKKGERKRETRK